MSYTNLLYHIVLRTYQSENTINTEHERELYAYMLGFVKNQNAKLIRIGGMPDHIHLFVSLPTTTTVANFVQGLKISSSKWLKANKDFPAFNGWGKEYAAFTYSNRDMDMIINYIKNQKEHHKRTTFADEYRAFLLENGLEIREEYFMRD
ncbi:MAG: IS200/IS605 family transposase [Bacteroidales bacterium]|nr:IS200/IS605 family transposase [Bacteroidales bacterium]